MRGPRRQGVALGVSVLRARAPACAAPPETRDEVEPVGPAAPDPWRHDIGRTIASNGDLAEGRLYDGPKRGRFIRKIAVFRPAVATPPARSRRAVRRGGGARSP